MGSGIWTYIFMLGQQVFLPLSYRPVFFPPSRKISTLKQTKEYVLHLSWGTYKNYWWNQSQLGQVSHDLAADFVRCARLAFRVHGKGSCYPASSFQMMWLVDVSAEWSMAEHLLASCFGLPGWVSRGQPPLPEWKRILRSNSSFALAAWPWSSPSCLLHLLAPVALTFPTREDVVLSRT